MQIGEKNIKKFVHEWLIMVLGKNLFYKKKHTIFLKTTLNVFLFWKF
jgi:hypothetical protein